MGDQVLSINDVALDSASVSEAMRQLQCDAGDQLVLEILPKIRSRAMRMTSAASSLSTNSSITCQFLLFSYTLQHIIVISVLHDDGDDDDDSGSCGDSCSGGAAAADAAAAAADDDDDNTLQCCLTGWFFHTGCWLWVCDVAGAGIFTRRCCLCSSGNSSSSSSMSNKTQKENIVHSI